MANRYRLNNTIITRASMGSTTNGSGNRNIERVFLGLITVVMAFSFFQLFKVLEKDFAEVPRRLRDGSMMNLNADRPGERMRSLLSNGFYFQDQKDIALIGA